MPGSPIVGGLSCDSLNNDYLLIRIGENIEDLMLKYGSCREMEIWIRDNISQSVIVR